MTNKTRREPPRLGHGLPHSSWNLDRPIMFASREPATNEPRGGERRRVTPDEIWAVVDAG